MRVNITQDEWEQWLIEAVAGDDHFQEWRAISVPDELVARWRAHAAEWQAITAAVEAIAGRYEPESGDFVQDEDLRAALWGWGARDDAEKAKVTAWIEEQR